MVNFLAICSIKNVNILIIEYYEIKWRIKKEDLKKYCSKKQLLKFQDQSLSVSFSCVHIACFFNLHAARPRKNQPGPLGGQEDSPPADEPPDPGRSIPTPLKLCLLSQCGSVYSSVTIAVYELCQ